MDSAFLLEDEVIEVGYDAAHEADLAYSSAFPWRSLDIVLASIDAEDEEVIVGYGYDYQESIK